MKNLNKYKLKDYYYYEDHANHLLNSCYDLNSWLEKKTIKELEIWMMMLIYINDNEILFLEESKISLTLIIKLYILEMDIDLNILKIDNKTKKKLIDIFEHRLISFYSKKKNI